jgi:hypothetical protein
MQAGPASSPAPPVEGVGSFHNFKFAGEQQSGYGVDLWREAGRWTGVFIVAEGVPQPSCGPLRMAGPEADDGDLIFSATVGTGPHSCPIHAAVPGKEAFNFTGRLRGDQVSGTLRRQDLLHPEIPLVESSIKLKRDKSGALPDYPSMAQWERAEGARCPAPPL